MSATATLPSALAQVTPAGAGGETALRQLPRGRPAVTLVIREDIKDWPSDQTCRDWASEETCRDWPSDQTCRDWASEETCTSWPRSNACRKCQESTKRNKTFAYEISRLQEFTSKSDVSLSCSFNVTVCSYNKLIK